MLAASSTESGPSNRGTRPDSTPRASGGLTTSPARNPMVMTTSRLTTTASNAALAVPVLRRQEDHRDRADDEPAERERHPEQQVQGDRPADDLGQVGRGGHDLGLHPVRQARAPTQPGTEHARQRLPGDDAELGGLVLHEHRHRVGGDQHPQQQVAVPGTGGEVGGHVAGVDVGDGGDERRPEQRRREVPGSPRGRGGRRRTHHGPGFGHRSPSARFRLSAVLISANRTLRGGAGSDHPPAPASRVRLRRPPPAPSPRRPDGTRRASGTRAARAPHP